MKVITSVTTHITAEGTRISFTYSEIDNNGNIVLSNDRVTKIVTDESILKGIETINNYALSLLEDE